MEDFNHEANVTSINAEVKSPKINGKLILLIVIGVIVISALFIVAIILFGHKHKYSDATCIVPRTCECGHTEGEPINHTVSIGKCTNCGEIQGGEILLNISDKITYANEFFEEGFYSTAEYKESDCDLYTKINYSRTAINYFEKAKSIYKEAYDMCGTYPELKELRNSLLKITTYNFSSVNSMYTLFFTHYPEVSEFGESVMNMLNEFKKHL